MDVKDFMWFSVGYDASPPTPTVKLKLGIEGQFFTLNGQPFTVIQSSEFSLFKRYLDGEDINPVLRQRSALGFNTLRVWLLNTSVVAFRNGTQQDGIHPAQHSDFYTRLRAFCGVCESYGLIVELTVFTSTPDLMPNHGDQQLHLNLAANAVMGLGNVLLELVNENDHETNGVKDNEVWNGLTRPGGVLISRGSSNADNPPNRHDNPWDYEEYHTNGLSEFQRKVGHNAMEWADQSHKPCVSNENTRYPDQDSSEIHAEDAAENGALLCAGSCYHSQAGKASVLFTGIELNCAGKWAGGAKKVPLEFQKGRYAHLVELEGPNCIRAHARILGDGRQYVSMVRP